MFTLLMSLALAFGGQYKGTAQAENEQQALERAWTNAVIQMAMAEAPETVEIISHSNESLDKGTSDRSIMVRIDKLDLSKVVDQHSETKNENGAFTATRIISGSLKPKTSDNEIKPFRYIETMKNPKIRMGMSKSELLMLFGKPKSVTFDKYEQKLLLVFDGKACVDGGIGPRCYIWVSTKTDTVINFSDVKAEYTELLK